MKPIPWKTKNRGKVSLPTLRPTGETLKADSIERATKAFKDPFLGVTTDGILIPELYSIHSTGVSTSSIVAAARTFLNTLDPKQRDEACFSALDIEWRKWANQANYYRDGLWFEKMSEAQREAALADGGIPQRQRFEIDPGHHENE